MKINLPNIFDFNVTISALLKTLREQLKMKKHSRSLAPIITICLGCRLRSLLLWIRKS